VLKRIWRRRPDGFTIEIPTWHRDDRWISHPGIQENVLCDWSLCPTVKKCRGSPIRVHKVITRTNT
jgi:hypothetical protein